MSIDKDNSFWSKSNYFDVLSEIDAKLELSQIQWELHHGKGNEDDQFGPLERWARLKV